MKKYFAIGFLMVALMLVLPTFVKAENPSGVGASINPNTNTESLMISSQQQLNQLLEQINKLQAELSRLQGEVKKVGEQIENLTKSLKPGSEGKEVETLQKFLKQDPEIYPEGKVTGYYGPLTEKAVKKFQQKNGIESVGIVGPITMTKINESIGGNNKDESKITICHIPDGNTSNKQTITISKSALESHTVHGDMVGACTSPQLTTLGACTTDAKLCSNGSYVSRTGPNCEFASCPVNTTSQYYLTIVSPNGGETWTTGSSQYIKWSSNLPATQNIMTVRVRDSAGTEHYLLSEIQNDGVELLAVPATLASGMYRFEMKTATGSQTVYDQSDGMVTIVNSNVSTTPVPVATKVITTSIGSGSGTISPGTISVTVGGNQTFTITPTTGYQTVSVMVDGVNQGAISSYAFTNVQAPHTILATFSLIPVTQCMLTVSLAASTPAAQSISPGQNAVPLVKFNATPNCDGTLHSFAVSLLPMPSGYQNISALRLYNDTTGVQLGTTQSITGASVNFTFLNAPVIANQALVLRVVGDVSSSAINGSTVYGVFGGSYGVISLGATIGNNASGNIIMGNTMTVATIIPTQDSTSVTGTNPRIMYWWGKVNQHTDTGGNWLTDPDGVSGADLDKLTYCKKFYPNTIGVEDYMLETTNTWLNRGNVDGPFTSTKMSTKCLQPTVSTIQTNNQMANVLQAMQGILNQLQELLKNR